jgi:myo-inositol-1(or 4)-monophosphatase
MMYVDLPALRSLVETAATVARRHAAAGVEVRTKPDDSPVTAADLEINQLLVDGLPTLAGAPVVAEESAVDPARLESSAVWLVDPIDGTRHFVAGLPSYAIHVALAVHGRPTVSVVAFPARRELYMAVRGEGAWIVGEGDGRRDALPAAGIPLLAGSLPPEPALHAALQERLGLPVLNFPKSTGAPMTALAHGAFAVAVGGPGSSEWDLAAPLLIVEEAGGVVTDHDGAPYRFNRPDLRCPAWVATRGFDHGSVLDVIRELRLPR